MLIIALKRFEFVDDRINKNKKAITINQRISFPKSLCDDDFFCSMKKEKTTSNKVVNYQLASVVLHIGDRATDGHYTCLVKTESSYVLCNDSRITFVDLKEQMDNIEHNSYLLFYERQ